MSSNSSEFRIRSETNGTYMRCLTPIGPAFGASWEETTTFTSGLAAYRVMAAFPITVDAVLVNADGESCDIHGRAIDQRGAAATGEGE